ncbi:MAG: asparagine synthase (glutamine-hydrolyzing) [Gammaproteobacteria bacterium]|nr:asparagine synthase (glutamine-hydrolyzing) [Gammaproteobacteria bacterium]
MCGIAGYLTRKGAAEYAVLNLMLDRIAHRGPDDRGVWTDGHVGLGHVRLSLLDLTDRGHQPAMTPDGTGVLVYNGEVYNFSELRRLLEQTGVRFNSRSDTEVVLHALHTWGPERAVTLFNGMFAFAYFNRRDGTLWLGRDRLGIKPLYLARTASSLVFGSEIKALLAHPEMACRPDMHALVTQLVYERLDGGWTLFEGIESIQPGTLVRMRGETSHTITYFDILRDIDPQRILAGAGMSFMSAAQRFEELFHSSVERHLICDAPIAVLCSGGLDSSLITAAAKEHRPGVVAYVADIAGMGGEEAARAGRVCDHLGVELRQVPVEIADFYRLWPQAICANDQPNYFAQNVAALAVADAMRRDGFKAVLAGDGADELFGGYAWQADAYRMWRRRRLHAAWIRDNALFRLLGRLNPLLAPLNLAALAERPFAHVHHPGESGLAGPKICAVDGAKRHLREAALFRRLESLPLHEERAFLARSCEDVYVHLAEMLRTNDRMTMWRSIEARVPFLDNELIDFGLHLPCRMKYHRGVTKRLVHALALKRLPQDIVRRPKIGFHAPSSLWSGLADFLLGGRLAELLKWRSSDQQAILHMFRKHPRMLYRLLSTELWVRIYLHGESPASLGESMLQLRLKAGS